MNGRAPGTLMNFVLILSSRVSLDNVNKTLSFHKRIYQYSLDIYFKTVRYRFNSINEAGRLSKQFCEICKNCVVMLKLPKNATRAILLDRAHHSPRLSAIVLPNSGFAEITMVAFWNRKTVDIHLQLH